MPWLGLCKMAMGGKIPPQRERLGAATLLPSSSSSLGAAATPPLPGWGWEAHDPALVHGSSRFLKHSKIWPEPLFYSTPPSAAGRRPNCVFIYFCIFPAPRTHWRGVGGSRGRLPRRTQKKQGGAAPPVPPGPGGSREARGREQEGGDADSITHPLCFVRTLGEIKNSCIHRVAASATKSVLSGGSCKLFAAPGNQHLGLQSPPGPFLPCQKQPLPFSNPHVSCQQSANTGSPPGKKGGTRFDFVSCFVALFNSRPRPPLRAVTEGFAVSNPTRRGQDTPVPPSSDRNRDAPVTGMTFLPGIPLRNRKTGAIAQHYPSCSPLVVPTNLSPWPTKGLERIKTNLVPTATWCIWQVQGCATGSSFHTPSLAPKNSRERNNTVVLLVLLVGCSHLCRQAQTPRDWGMLWSWDQTPTAAAPSSAAELPLHRFNLSTRKKKWKKKK